MFIPYKFIESTLLSVTLLGSHPAPPPTVNAGPNQTITLPASANLNGTTISSTTLTTTWSEVRGPGTVTFGNVNAQSTTASFSAAGTYVLQLSASDGVLTSTSSVTITVNPPAGTSARLLFKTGFEGTTTLGSVSGNAPDDSFQLFSGTDTTTGFSWPINVGNPDPGLTGIHAIPYSGSSGPLANYFSNAIQSVQGHNGSQTNALMMKLDGFPQNSCCAQDSFGSTGLADNLTSLYIRLWVNLPPDLLTQVQTYKDNFYRTMFAFKTYTDYRIESYIYGDANGVPYWYAHGDNLADGSTAPYQEYWAVSNHTVPVPFNQWFAFEIYFKRSTGNDGRFFWAVNGQTIGDRLGPNYGINNERILEIMYQDVYQNWFPAYQWIDDLEIWDSPPCSALPCGAGNLGSGAPPPTITAVTPATGSQGSIISATVSGSNLSGVTSVSFSGAGVTAGLQPGATASQIPITVTIAPNAKPGPQAITVTTSAGTATLSSAFTVQPVNEAVTAPQPIPEVEQGPIHSGYVVITPDPNTVTPTPAVTFGTVSSGVIQSQAGTFPAQMATDASLFVDVIPGIGRNLGLALANPGSGPNTINLILSDVSGAAVGTPVAITLQAQQQLSRFVTDLFPQSVIGPAVQGNLRIQSSAPFAVIGLRFSGTNFSTLPLVENATSPGVPSRVLTSGSTPSTPLAGTIGGTSAVILPQFAMGGGWATQIAFVNSSATTMSGRIDIFDTSGNAMTVGMNGATQSTFTYSIPAGGAFVLAPRDTNGQSPF
jgi:hypothetical protein